MKVLIQRVKRASVTIDNKLYSKIDKDEKRKANIDDYKT